MPKKLKDKSPKKLKDKSPKKLKDKSPKKLKDIYNNRCVICDIYTENGEDAHIISVRTEFSSSKTSRHYTDIKKYEHLSWKDAKKIFNKETNKIYLCEDCHNSVDRTFKADYSEDVLNFYRIFKCGINDERFNMKYFSKNYDYTRKRIDLTFNNIMTEIDKNLSNEILKNIDILEGLIQQTRDIQGKKISSKKIKKELDNLIIVNLFQKKTSEIKIINDLKLFIHELISELRIDDQLYYYITLVEKIEHSRYYLNDLSLVHDIVYNYCKTIGANEKLQLLACYTTKKFINYLYSYAKQELENSDVLNAQLIIKNYIYLLAVLSNKDEKNTIKKLIKRLRKDFKNNMIKIDYKKLKEYSKFIIKVGTELRKKNYSKTIQKMEGTEKWNKALIKERNLYCINNF